MTDPRIRRTRLHVLATARAMIAEKGSEPLTISSLAREAQISRRTLYVHWQTIEELTSEALADSALPALESRHTDSSLEDRLQLFLREIRDHLKQRLPKIAETSSAHFAATADENALDQLKDMQQQRLNLFRATVAPVTADRFAQIVGPIYFAELQTGKSASRQLIESQVALGIALLGADKTTEPQT
ncbi:helix-turn-helix domain containing protein [Agreia sp. PsM10]|uniref:TetR/AcrR family transcriptional regulator n=1 Tax=Agreia sp. PsM10 TaxID=3030533 RepID=UPI00263BDCAD|nr:TetR/AcrR family transcriptional regulator [Agreia sp. PsM10]MDN4641610.1 helix-turn-helix domain containing protein [Agreia sp. PsM10]